MGGYPFYVGAIVQSGILQMKKQKQRDFHKKT
jgi:hypothetical protein